jgi:small subunit ribosomal protein S6e
MVEFKVVLSDPRSGHAYNLNVSGGAANGIIGRKIGDELDASPLGIAGYRIRLTGGSDRNGTPARRNLPVAGMKKILLAGGVGFRPRMDGERRRKSIRGNEITPDFVQINALVTEYGEKPLEEYFVKPAEEKKAE